jgi:hypothetical protein
VPLAQRRSELPPCRFQHGRESSGCETLQLRSTLDAELRQREFDLEEELRSELALARLRSYIPVRDLLLREFALETQVATYRPYPASPAYKVSVSRLAEIRAERERAEQQLAQALDALERQSTQRLATARTDVEQKFASQIASYRGDLEGAAEREVNARLASVETVLGSLEPLQRPVNPRDRESTFAPIPAPSQVTAGVKQPGAPTSDSALGDLKAQRERLAAYLEKDVKRRLERLAIQHRWRLAYGPTPGLDDITSTAAQLLSEEWTP